jgi:nicotinamidase-related amidase
MHTNPTGLLQAARSQLVLVDHQQRLMPAIADGARVAARALRLARLAQSLQVPCTGTEQSPEQARADRGAAARAVRAGAGQDALRRLRGRAARARAGRRRGRARAGGDRRLRGDACLLQTALGLRAAGLSLWVVADACGSRDRADRELALARLQGAGAVLVSSEMVGFEWVREAGHPQFRTLQALVR